MFLSRLLFASSLACGFTLQIAQTESVAPPKEATAKPSPNDPAALSAGFWTDWKKTESSESYAALKAAVGKANTAPATEAVKTQRIIDVALSKPADAAKVMSAATAASSDAASSKAMQTVITMIASPKTLEEAVPLVAPEAKERVETWRANLKTGIAGLPGIYLGDNAVANGGERQPAPVGYAPVAGGSAGCPVR